MGGRRPVDTKAVTSNRSLSARASQLAFWVRKLTALRVTRPVASTASSFERRSEPNQSTVTHRSGRHFSEVTEGCTERGSLK